RDELKKNNSEAVDVAAPVGCVGFALRLLRRHIGRGADYLSVHSHRDLAHFASREAEVHEVRLSLPVDQDIGGFQVTMHNALFVCMLESVANFDTEQRCFTA